MNDYRLLIERVLETEKEIVGNLYFLDKNDAVVFSCNTLDLKYRDNKNNVSAYPTGKYKVKQRTSAKYKKHLHILDVPNRSYILIHNANYYRQLRGCTAVGYDLIDIDGDSELDVTDSVKTLKNLIETYERYADGEELELEVINTY